MKKVILLIILMFPIFIFAEVNYKYTNTEIIEGINHSFLDIGDSFLITNDHGIYKVSKSTGKITNKFYPETDEYIDNGGWYYFYNKEAKRITTTPSDYIYYHALYKIYKLDNDLNLIKTYDISDTEIEAYNFYIDNGNYIVFNDDLFIYNEDFEFIKEIELIDYNNYQIDLANQKLLMNNGRGYSYLDNNLNLNKVYYDEYICNYNPLEEPSIIKICNKDEEEIKEVNLEDIDGLVLNDTIKKDDGYLITFMDVASALGKGKIIKLDNDLKVINKEETYLPMLTYNNMEIGKYICMGDLLGYSGEPTYNPGLCMEIKEDLTTKPVKIEDISYIKGIISPNYIKTNYNIAPYINDFFKTYNTIEKLEDIPTHGEKRYALFNNKFYSVSEELMTETEVKIVIKNLTDNKVLKEEIITQEDILKHIDEIYYEPVGILSEFTLHSLDNYLVFTYYDGENTKITIFDKEENIIKEELLNDYNKSNTIQIPFTYDIYKNTILMNNIVYNKDITTKEEIYSQISLISLPYNKTINIIGNGTIKLDKELYPYEEISLSSIGIEGYELESISIKTTTGKIVDIIDNKFIMPEEDIIIDVVFENKTLNPNTFDTIITIIALLMISGILFNLYRKRYLFLKN